MAHLMHTLHKHLFKFFGCSMQDSVYRFHCFGWHPNRFTEISTVRIYRSAKNFQGVPGTTPMAFPTQHLFATNGAGVFRILDYRYWDGCIYSHTLLGRLCQLFLKVVQSD